MRKDVSQDKDVPGVIAPPPLVFLFFLACGIAADLAYGPFVPAVAPEYMRLAGGGLVAMGIAIMIFAIGGFRRAGTPVPTREPTSALVTTGLNGLSRNPIYIALFLFYLGIAVAVNSLAALVLALPLAAIMRHGVVAREEAYLERKFGDDYRAYKARVPRWL